MRIVCPSCQATYEVPDAMLARGPADPRPPLRVRCARCAREWAPAEAAAPPHPLAPAPMPQPPAPAPTPFADALAHALPAEIAPPLPPSGPPPGPPPGPPAIAQPAPPLPANLPTSLAAARPSAYPSGRPPARPGARPAPERNPATVLFAWCLSLGVVGALLWAAYARQAEVVAAWPPAARIYQALHLS